MKVKGHWIVGSLFILLFAFLLILRLGVLEEGAEQKAGRILTGQIGADQETWMNISQQGQKIGYAHRQFYKTGEGYRIFESVFMRVNIMGMLQEIRFKTEGNFHPDLTLSSFDFELQSSLFRFKARGVLQGKVLTLFTDQAGSEQKVDLTLEKESYLSVGLLKAIRYEDLIPGDSRTFHVFDPATMAQRPVKVDVLVEETIPILGGPKKAKKVSVHFMGVPQFAWIGEDGTVLKEEGSLGIGLERVSREAALDKVTLSKGADLAEVASIPAGKILPEATGLRELKIQIDGIGQVEKTRPPGEVFLRGGRQSFENNRLTIRKEPASSLLSFMKGKMVFEDGKTHLEATPFIQSDHPEIQIKAREIVSVNDPLLVKAKKLVTWVNKNIQKRPVLSVPNALETLHHRMGDCNEHAVLLAALARASGIPAQVEAGIVYQKGQFYYHAWNVFYLGTWITADAVMDQLPADVTHIRFVRGMERQVDLVQMIGKVKLEILSYE
ncbi:MAG: transglutaminase-like domain-containing protein [Thermodesulfobacteriota bacterium]